MHWFKNAKKGFRLQNLQSKLYLDSNKHGNVYTYASNGGDFQVWHYFVQEDGYGLIRNKANGKYLSINEKGTVKTIDYKEFDLTQHWQLDSLTGFTYLINRATGLVLDSNRQRNVYLMGKNDGDFQKWSIESLDKVSCLFRLSDTKSEIVLNFNCRNWSKNCPMKFQLLKQQVFVNFSCSNVLIKLI